VTTRHREKAAAKHALEFADAFPEEEPDSVDGRAA
jgi:hypothetical protein